MLVCDIMTKHVVCVRMDDTLEAVREILSTRRIHHVVVLDKQQVVGIISDYVYTLVDPRIDFETREV